MATQYTPTFSPVGGTYTGSQTVTITSSGATAIYYTTDGSIPTIASTLYSAPVTVSATGILSAIAVKTGLFNSPVARANYVINNLVAAWKIIEGSGTLVADTSGNANNMTTSAAWTGAISPLANALVCPGTGPIANSATTISYERTVPFSVAMWIKFSAHVGSIISTLDLSNNTIGWELAISNTPTQVYLFLCNTNPGNNLQVISNTLLSLNTLYHIVMTYDGDVSGAGTKFYVNGAVTVNTIVAHTLTATTITTKPVSLGDINPTANPYTGSVGAVYIFKGALTASDALALYTDVYLPGATYYVSAGGSNSNDGLTPATSWQTMAKVNAHAFTAGDSILFNGGDTFTGPMTATLLGTSSFPITISSYGTGRATINGGNGDGIDLTNSQYFVISNLNVTGAGWTGTGLTIVPVNTGTGISHLCTATTGAKLQNATITNCTVSGFYLGVSAYTKTINTVGFNNVTVSNCNLSNNLIVGFVSQGYQAFAGGAVNQSTNISVLNCIISNVPGDPNNADKSEAAAIEITNCTGIYVTGNYCSHIAGFGGALSGLLLGGSNAIGVANCRNAFINGNEIAYTLCSTSFDGCAIDFDQDSQNCEAAYNLTYNNMGPCVQWGSFTGKTTQNVKIHHNLSYNDVRGNNAHSNNSEQGVFRSWGGANSGANFIYNNTVYLDPAGTLGTPSCFSVDTAVTASPQVVSNNIFKVKGGINIIHANQTFGPCHLGTQSIINNLYDASGDALLISNDTGAAYVNVTTLVAWQAAGYEKIVAVLYGVVGVSNLANLVGFSPPSDGYLAHGTLPPLSNFDLAAGSAASTAGVNNNVVAGAPTIVGTGDWHGFPIPASPLNIGALSSTSSSSSGTGGKLELLLVGVGS